MDRSPDFAVLLRGAVVSWPRGVYTVPMAKALDALDYLAKPAKYSAVGVCAAFGDEPFLKRQVLGCLARQVLGDDDRALSMTTFDGRTTSLGDVLDELSTVAMFGERRLVVVEDADAAIGRARAVGTPDASGKKSDVAAVSFVSRYRGELESYVAKPSPTGTLVLLVNSLPSNTRLYKAIVADGLAIDCSTPSAGRLGRWVTTWSETAHRAKLAPAAADMLIELVGSELGLLDQELAKLSGSVGPGGEIGPELIAQMVGSWRSQTVWVMLDAALDGKLPDALTQLDRLLLAGESPIAILGQMAASLRRFAAATRLILDDEAAGRRVDVRSSLERAGVKRFVLDTAGARLRRLGRHRGAQLYRWLLETDLALKGASAMPSRLILEHFLVRIGSPEAKTFTSAAR